MWELNNPFLFLGNIFFNVELTLAPPHSDANFSHRVVLSVTKLICFSSSEKEVTICILNYPGFASKKHREKRTRIFL